MANTYLTWTPSANPTGSAKTWTFSAWLKFGSENPGMFLSAGSGTQSKFIFGAYGGGDIDILTYAGYVININTARLFRDLNAWYHVVLSCDTTQATNTNGIKLYINGVQETLTFNSAGGENGYTQNTSLRVGTNGEPIHIGRNIDDSQYFNGSMSYVAFVDGQQLTPSTFGETDSTTGEWKIKTSITPGGTGWGTNGFFILKDGNSVTDQSGQGNNFSVGGGTLTKTEDSPSNVFATMNVLANFGTQWALFENVNTYVRSAGSGEAFIASNLGIPATSGKFYTEVKYTQGGSASNIGISGRMNPTAAADYVGNKADSYVYRQNGQKKSDDVASSYGNSYAVGDIIGIAVDATNSKIYFSKNGVWQNSGDPTSGATGTGAAFTISTTPTDGFYFMACAKESGSDKNYYAWNFGNGYFQTTAVSSAGTNASGIGIFEYDVPTGYTALSTKGLNL